MEKQVEGWDSSDALKKEEEDGGEEKRVEQSKTSKQKQDGEEKGVEQWDSCGLSCTRQTRRLHRVAEQEQLSQTL